MWRTDEYAPGRTGSISKSPAVNPVGGYFGVDPVDRIQVSGAATSFGAESPTLDALEALVESEQLVRHAEEYYLRVGAGIVYDSNPDAEYDETLAKARALLTAVDEVL